MLIREIVEILHGEVMCCEDKLDREVMSACSSDMMSDVLAYVKDQAVLVTGLNNPQIIRTATMMDMVCVVLVRGKRPDSIMLKLAEKSGIVLICASQRMFLACGMLYEAGLKAEN
jgi:predicted transcriptional regulator